MLIMMGLTKSNRNGTVENSIIYTTRVFTINNRHCKKEKQKWWVWPKATAVQQRKTADEQLFAVPGRTQNTCLTHALINHNDGDDDGHKTINNFLYVFP